MRKGSASRFLFVTLGLLAVVPMGWNVYWLSRDMVLGDGSSFLVSPRPVHGYLRVPADRDLPGTGHANRLAADFAQIYFPSQDLSRLTENYRTGALDPWGRPSRQSSVQHRLCAVTACRLPYGRASIVHIAVQLLVFAVAFVHVHRRLGLESHLPGNLLLAGVCLFLTPVGLSWFERGQFTLYAATSCMLLVVGLLKKSYAETALAGLFGHLKWTSFPFLAIVTSLFLLSSRSLWQLKKNLGFALALAAPIVVLLLLFPRESYFFVAGLLDQEARVEPMGPLSLSRLLPRELVKLLPLALLALGGLFLRLNGCRFDCRLIPFFAASIILLMTYPTVAWNYSLPAALGFVPLLFYWARRSPGEEMAKLALAYGYVLFLFLGSDFLYRNWLVYRSLAEKYVLFGATFLAIGLGILAWPKIAGRDEPVGAR